MFTDDDFALLRFIEGRWKGALPGGAVFFEAYTFPTPTEMRSTRFADGSFETPTDGSSVRLADGRIVSAWGPFTWAASDVTATRACFEPLRAPSSFCWIEEADGQVRVEQRWTDEAGEAQQAERQLRRLPPPGGACAAVSGGAVHRGCGNAR